MAISSLLEKCVFMIKFDFSTIPTLSGKVVEYICPKCQHDKCVPLDYKSKRGYHHKYKK